MDYTENYQLSQWDAEDRIMRADFNRDNASIESGLSTLKEGLETEVQERAAAVTAARQEASQALTAAAGALESGKADKTALSQLQAQVDALPFVKLRSITVGQAVNQVDVDMQDVSLTDYSYLVIMPRVAVSGASFFYVRINGYADKSYSVLGSSREYLLSCRTINDATISKIELMEVNGEIKAIRSTATSGGEGNISAGEMKKSVLTAPQMQTINFVGEDGSLIQQGSQIQIYGVKR